jgi:hypothetical protein
MKPDNVLQRHAEQAVRKAFSEVLFLGERQCAKILQFRDTFG